MVGDVDDQTAPPARPIKGEHPERQAGPDPEPDLRDALEARADQLDLSEGAESADVHELVGFRALQLGDLDGRVLTIERAASGEVIGPTKTRTVRRLTLGPTSADLWQASIQAWRARSGSDAFGPWLFSADPGHGSRLTTGGLGHWFAQLCAAAGMPEVTLHRLRHSVATVLVGRGQILQAQYRLGHADAYTTLRIYSHAQPLHDWTPRTPSASCTGDLSIGARNGRVNARQSRRSRRTICKATQERICQSR